MLAHLQKNEKILFIVAAILAIPAFFYNLGLMPLGADEPIRSLVALEMILSDNYIVPTINGQLYTNKPPLYNWVLILLFKATGNYSEFMVRLPSALPLLFFAYTIYKVGKQYVNKNVGVFAALMFLTNGRMLIYSSLLGHIDIFYSWLVFISFIMMFKYSKKEQYWQLFVFTYLITAAGFLMKGLPSLVFQGFSLLTLFIYQKKFKKLFTIQHLVGGLVFLLLVGGYFYLYNQQESATDFLNRLWFESNKRTVIKRAWYESIAHLFMFPLNQIYHLLPWSLLVVFFFKKGTRKQIWQHDFLKFALLIVGANIIVYWLSPRTHPRYIFMLYPLLFIVVAYAYQLNRKHFTKLADAMDWVLIVLFGLGGVGVWYLPFNEIFQAVVIPYLYIKVALISVLLLVATYLFWKLKAQRLVLFAILLLTFRIAFDFFALPIRNYESEYKDYKAGAIKAGQISKGHNLYLIQGAHFSYESAYYVNLERNDILTIVPPKTINPDSYYLVENPTKYNREYEVFHTFFTRVEHTQLKLVKFAPLKP